MPICPKYGAKLMPMHPYPVPIQCRYIPVCCQSNANPGQIRCTSSVHLFESYVNLVPIQCPSDANPVPIRCQLNSNPSQSDSNPLPIYCQISANRSPIRQSDVNPGLICQANLPIHDQSAIPLSILYRSANSLPIRHFNTNLTIRHQCANPMSILDQSANPKSIHSQSMSIQYQSITNPPIQCQSITNPPIQCQSITLDRQSNVNPGPIDQSIASTN